MEPKNGGLEDDFPFQLDDFLRFHVHFHGCSARIHRPCGDWMKLLPLTSQSISHQPEVRGQFVELIGKRLHIPTSSISIQVATRKIENCPTLVVS